LKYVVGVDEVGIGSLAGPVAAAGVVFPCCGDIYECLIEGLKDSKKLSKNKRIQLDKLIRRESTYWVIAIAGAGKINEYGIGRCQRECIDLCIERCLNRYSNSLVIVDGNRKFENASKVRSMPQADKRIPSVSAASVIAKVCRDNMMCELHQKHPEYKFKNNMGYPTSEHKEALSKYGICAQHRLNYKPVRELASRGN
jgi:ribonuclease HII